MSKPLSLDLRERVVGAVTDGLSCRQAAERFGVSPASAVRWCALERDQGDPKPKAMGGDQRSQCIEAHADFIMDAVPYPLGLQTSRPERLDKATQQSARLPIATMPKSTVEIFEPPSNGPPIARQFPTANIHYCRSRNSHFLRRNRSTVTVQVTVRILL